MRGEVRPAALKSLLDWSGTIINREKRPALPACQGKLGTNAMHRDQTVRTTTLQGRGAVREPKGTPLQEPRPRLAHLAPTKASRAGRLPEPAGPTHLTPRPPSQNPLAPSGPRLRAAAEFAGRLARGGGRHLRDTWPSEGLAFPGAGVLWEVWGGEASLKGGNKRFIGDWAYACLARSKGLRPCSRACTQRERAGQKPTRFRSKAPRGAAGWLRRPQPAGRIRPNARS